MLRDFDGRVFEQAILGDRHTAKQVPADGKGQYFKIEKYYLEHPQIDIIQKSADVLITVSGDDTYMIVYNPTEESKELIDSLAVSEGLFMWKPNN